MRNVLLILILALVPAMMFAACIGPGEVATDPAFIPPGVPSVSTGIEIVDDEGYPTGRSWAIVDADAPLKEGAPTIAPEGVAEGDLNTTATIGRTLIPFLPAPLQPFGALIVYGAARMFGKRYRQNWGSAISSATKGDLRGAVRMAAAAEGVVHTTEDPEVLERVAAKKRAEQSIDSAHARGSKVLVHEVVDSTITGT